MEHTLYAADLQLARDKQKLNVPLKRLLALAVSSLRSSDKFTLQ